jgi:hypothetical protein
VKAGRPYPRTGTRELVHRGLSYQEVRIHGLLDGPQQVCHVAVPVLPRTRCLWTTGRRADSGVRSAPIIGMSPGVLEDLPDGEHVVPDLRVLRARPLLG